jgi:hypothetical protein
VEERGPERIEGGGKSPSLLCLLSTEERKGEERKKLEGRQ